MTFYYSNGLKFFRFPCLEEQGVVHAAITRRGGVSPAPWQSLNLGGTVGDEVNRVQENRQRACAALQLPFGSLFDVWQVHSDRVVVAGAPRPPGQPIQQADAILTDRPDVTLFMRFADCVPIFLYDPVKKVVGLAHAGWMGTVRRTAGKTVEVMAEVFGSLPQDILAALGPSIAAHHYPVGPDVIAQVRQAFGENADELLEAVPDSAPQGGEKFDLWQANRLVLQEKGVRQVEISGLCTACDKDDWYSHRAEQGSTGRFGALIALPR